MTRRCRRRRRALGRGAARLATTQGELFGGAHRSTAVLDDVEQLALHLSDALTLRYFSHVYEPPHAT